MKRYFALIVLMFSLPMLFAQIDDLGAFGGFGEIPQNSTSKDTSKKKESKTTSSSTTTTSVPSIFDDDLDVTPSEFDDQQAEERVDRYRSPMKFTRNELNNITDPRIRDLYWYALNDTTDRKRYLRAHYAFNEMKDNWAFEVRGGVQTVMMDYIKERFSLGPQVEFGFKKDVHPYWAIRLDASWSHLTHELYTSHLSTMLSDKAWKDPAQVGGGDWWQEVDFNSLGLRAAVLLNFVNLYAGREMLYTPFLGYLYAGAGFVYSYKALNDRNGSCLVPQWFAGFQLVWNLNQRYSLIFDANGSWQSDDMMGYTTQNSTWKYASTLGIAYKFSKVIHFQRLGYDESFVKPTIVDEDNEEQVLQTVIEQSLDAELVSDLPSDMIQAAFFQIDRVELQHTYVLNLGFYAELIKSHPTQRFLVKGFADIEVGSKKRNLWLSEQRAKVVADVLVKTYGCNPDQLVVGGGDLDYDIPFLREQGHHRFNRCTIVCPLDKDYQIIKEKTFEDPSELMDGRIAPTVKNY